MNDSDDFAFPYEVTVEAPSQAADDKGIRGDPVYGAAATVKVDFQASAKAADFTSYGVEGEGAAVLRCPVSKISLFPLLARVMFEGIPYYVVAAGGVRPHSTLGYAAFIMSRNPQVP